MSRKKLKIYQTDPGNLISNLRGEIGEIITSWVLYKDLILIIHRIKSSDPLENIKDPSLNRLFTLTDKLTDDIVARLSELAEKKIGRLNFHFASEKLNKLGMETDEFIKYIKKNNFKEKRDKDISHKELPEQWSDHRYLHIKPKIILKGIAIAHCLIKKFDNLHLGPSAKFLWYEMRKKRYEPMPMPSPKSGYLLLPYLRLSNEIRKKVALTEIKMGLSKWDDLPTEINGKKAYVKANKKWGVVLLGNTLLVTSEYPLIKLKSIEIQEKRKPNKLL